MWLGMLAAAVGQVPGLPVGPINALEAPLLAYIAQVAAWCGRPSWAYLEVRIGIGGLVASYFAIGAGRDPRSEGRPSPPDGGCSPAPRAAAASRQRRLGGGRRSPSSWPPA